jgi:hypothetical protein
MPIFMPALAAIFGPLRRPQVRWRMAKEAPHAESAAQTAHALNNLLQVIMGSLELVKRTRGEVPPETIEKALRATREAATLAQRLLAALKKPEDG